MPTVKDMLDRRNPEYRPRQIEDMDALYQGGSVFKRVADRFLTKRQIERDAPEMREARLSCAAYVPLAGFVVNTLTGAGTAAPVVLDASGPDADFFNSINTDANENGDDLPAICTEAIREAHVQGRSYLAVDFPDYDDESTSLAAQKESGTLDGRLCVLHAVDIDDWYPNRGALKFARTYAKRYIRTPDGMVQVEWCFKIWTPEYTQEFTGTSAPVPTDKFQEPDTATVQCVAGEQIPHFVGETPIYPLDAGIWTMDQLAPIATALFNRDTATTFALNAQAFSILVMKLAQNAGNGEPIKLSPLGILTLDNDPGTDAKYISSNTAQFDAQESNAAYLQKAMMMTISMLAAQASPSDYQRAPAASVGKSSAALEVILRHFSKKFKDALGKALSGLQKVRGAETTTIQIRGLDSFAEGSLAAEFNELILAKSAGLPPAAIQYMTREAALAAAAGAPADVRETIINQTNTGVSNGTDSNAGTGSTGDTNTGGPGVPDSGSGA